MARKQEDATAKASSQCLAFPDPSLYSQFSMSSSRVRIVLPQLAWNSSWQDPFPFVVLHRGKQFPIKLCSFFDLGLLSTRPNARSKTIESVPKPGFQVSHGSREQADGVPHTYAKCLLSTHCVPALGRDKRQTWSLIAGGLSFGLSPTPSRF